MPRKRLQRKVRYVPEVPEGDEGKNLTKEQQQEKLQVFLADYDRKFDEKSQEIALKIDLTLKRIDTYCQMGIQQIPKTLRKMKLVDFIAAGGTFESALEYLANKAEDESVDDFNVDSLKAIGLGNKTSDNQLYSDPTFQKIAAECASALEKLDSCEPQSTVRKGKSTRSHVNPFCPSTVKMPLSQIEELTGDDIENSVRRTMRQPRNRNAKSSMFPPSTNKRVLRTKVSNGKLLETPMLNWPSHNCMTPAYTPKFDPRLPMTPFDRSPKAGERLVSIAGSPVAVRHRSKKMDEIQQRINNVLIADTLNADSTSILNEVLQMFKEVDC